MFFDEIELSKQSWHYKLQELTFGSKMPNYFSFCPYFWLTVLCMLISPITLIIHSCILPFKLFDKYIFKPNIEKWLLNNSDIDLEINLFDNYYIYDSNKKKIPFCFYKKSNTVEYFRNILFAKKYKLDINDKDFYEKKELILDKLRKKSEELYNFNKKLRTEKYILEQEREKIKQEKYKRIENNFNKIISIIKIPFKYLFFPITYTFKNIKNIIGNDKINIAKLVKVTKMIILTSITIFGLYLFYLLFSYIQITSWNWKSFSLGFMYMFTFLGLKFIYSIILCITGYGFIKILIQITKFLYNKSTIFKICINTISKIFNNIGITLEFICKFLISPFKLFIIFIQTFKKDNCPAIIWKEENNN